MLDNNKNNCCEYLLHEIAFYKDSIRPCCSFSIKGDITPFLNEYRGDINGFNVYLELRDGFINIFNNGNEPICKKGCTIYKLCNSLDKTFKLKNIIISNYTKCSCNCIYCEQAAYGQDVEYKNWINKREAYDIKPLLTYLRDNNYIAVSNQDNKPSCQFLICGGECTEYPNGELEWLIYFAKSCNGSLLILSSGIKYSKAIEMALLSSNTILKISVDSGTKAMYEKIKRVKAYDITWNNITKYIQTIQNNNFNHQIYNSNVEIKYIIIPGINDSKSEINAFIKKCKDVKCNTIVLDVEHKWLAENKQDKNKINNLKPVLNYFLEKIYNEPNIRYSFEGVEEDLLWSLVKEKYNFKNGTK